MKKSIYALALLLPLTLTAMTPVQAYENMENNESNEIVLRGPTIQKFPKSDIKHLSKNGKVVTTVTVTVLFQVISTGAGPGTDLIGYVPGSITTSATNGATVMLKSEYYSSRSVTVTYDVRSGSDVWSCTSVIDF